MPERSRSSRWNNCTASRLVPPPAGPRAASTSSPTGRRFITRSARSATRGPSSAPSSPRRTCARPSSAPISCSPRSRSCCPSASPSPSSWARGSPDARSAPWTVLRAGVERAITTPNLPQDTLATLEETMQEIKRMTELVEALLTLARADEGIAPLHREPVDLCGIVEEARETGELLAEEAGVRMEVTTPAEPVVVSVDATRIRQLILNLLTNAVKYTPAGGSVRLRLGPANGRLTLSVADSGIGIAPGDLPHIFDRFWRADSARTRTGERPGAGLGLAICKWIAEAHGGQIDVVSRPGRGTTFTVTLPWEAPLSAGNS